MLALQGTRAPIRGHAICIEWSWHFRAQGCPCMAIPYALNATGTSGHKGAHPWPRHMYEVQLALQGARAPIRGHDIRIECTWHFRAQGCPSVATTYAWNASKTCYYDAGTMCMVTLQGAKAPIRGHSMCLSYFKAMLLCCENPSSSTLHHDMESSSTIRS
jgi:hypothetical protein